MGLDFLHLALGIEKNFHIKIPTMDLHQFSTVGDLHSYLVKRVSNSKGFSCQTSTSYLDLTDALKRNGTKTHIGPPSLISDIFPNKKNRRNQWKEWERTARLKLPELVRSYKLNVGCFAIAALLSTIARISGLSFLSNENHGPIFWFESTFLFTLFGWISLLLTIPLKTEIPNNITTMRKLSEKVLWLNRLLYQKRQPQMSRNDVWVHLKGLIVETLGVDDDEVVPEANFVTDLSCE